MFNTGPRKDKKEAMQILVWIWQQTI
jgi:hypothetical protein